MNNALDENGWPICPVCHRLIRPGRSAARSGDAIVHLDCWALERDRPTGPLARSLPGTPADPA
jgi:hypothetical protein